MPEISVTKYPADEKKQTKNSKRYKIYAQHAYRHVGIITSMYETTLSIKAVSKVESFKHYLL